MEVTKIEVSNEQRDEPSVEQSAERIERVATELFSERGFDAVGVRDIARAAQVPVSAINYYFGSKVDLYRECARSLLREYLQEAQAKVREGGGVRAVVEHYNEFAARNPRLIRMWLDFQLSGDAEANAYANREMMGPVWQLLTDRLDAEDDLTFDRRVALLSFIGSAILQAILTDDQIEMLCGAPAVDAKRGWERSRLESFTPGELAARRMQMA